MFQLFVCYRNLCNEKLIKLMILDYQSGDCEDYCLAHGVVLFSR
jgi:hypothetical protein